MSSKPIAEEELVSPSEDAPTLQVVTDAAEDIAQEPSPEALLKSVLADILGLDGEDAEALDKDSGLFGHMPELDSMAVAGLLTEIEDRFDIVIEDDDVDGEMLETFGGLFDFVVTKIAQD